MKLKKLLSILIVFLSLNIGAITTAEAHWHGGWHGGWGGHHHHGWGWGGVVPFVVEPYYYDYPHYYHHYNSVARANHLIALGHQKINQGQWYIDNGYPERGAALIHQGRILIAKGHAILGY